MVQNGNKISIVETSGHGNRLHGSTLRGGIVNVDRSRVGCINIEKVEGVCVLPGEKLLNLLTKEKMKTHTSER